jgi:hypothetical protein
VYKVFTFDPTTPGRLNHTLVPTGDNVPLVAEDKLAAFKQARRSMYEESLRRKRGDPFSERQCLKAKNVEDATWKPRHIECRGLRFCTETRMFYDRDGASARAIAGLRCIKLMGLGRPSVFSRVK